MKKEEKRLISTQISRHSTREMTLKEGILWWDSVTLHLITQQAHLHQLITVRLQLTPRF